MYNSDLPTVIPEEVAIAGTGKYARDIAQILHNNGVLVSCFIDEFSSSSFFGRPVVKAANVNVIQRKQPVFIAIANIEHRTACIKRLSEAGFNPSLLMYLNVQSNSERFSFLRIVDHMLKEDRVKAMALLLNNSGNMLDWEGAWHTRNISPSRLDTLSLNSYVSIRLTGAADGHFNHIKELIDSVQIHHQCEIISDFPSVVVAKQIFSLSAMQTRECKLAITASLTPCCPATAKQLTLLHTLYDSALYEGAEKTLVNGAKHFIAVASKPLMALFKNLCITHNLRDVVLIPAGYPKLDSAMANYSEMSDVEKPVLLYAPTPFSYFSDITDAKSHSILDAVKIFNYLLINNNKLRIVFRPYPDDLKNIQDIHSATVKEAFFKLLDMCEHHPRIRLDDAPTHKQSFQEASVLLTDLSSTAYSFAFTALKPTIVYNNASSEEKWSKTSYLRDRDKIGRICINPRQVLTAFTELSASKSTTTKEIYKLRDEQLYNLGSSIVYLTNCINHIVKGTRLSDWWSLSKN